MEVDYSPSYQYDLNSFGLPIVGFRLTGEIDQNKYYYDGDRLNSFTRDEYDFNTSSIYRDSCSIKYDADGKNIVETADYNDKTWTFTSKSTYGYDNNSNPFYGTFFIDRYTITIFSFFCQNNLTLVDASNSTEFTYNKEGYTSAELNNDGSIDKYYEYSNCD